MSLKYGKDCYHGDLWTWIWFSFQVLSLPAELPPSLHAPYKAILFSGALEERHSRLSFFPFWLILTTKYPHKYFLPLYPAEYYNLSSNIWILFQCKIVGWVWIKYITANYCSKKLTFTSIQMKSHKLDIKKEKRAKFTHTGLHATKPVISEERVGKI